MPHWDLLLTDARIATLQTGAAPYGILAGDDAGDGAIAVKDGNIVWLGPQSQLPQGTTRESRSLNGRWITPALIDCHTHLVFAGNRAAEFEQRLQGASYEDIARAGGGILSTVKATRAATEDELLELALPRAKALLSEGVSTIEIKSGYGLDLASELKMLAVAKRIGQVTGMRVQKTLLAAHTVPLEFVGDADGYIEHICTEILPQGVAADLVDAVDAYCETIAFSAEQLDRLFITAAELDLPVKVHADQLSNCGGAVLAARHNALSADHLEYSDRDAVVAMAAADAVAVLLPGAFLTLGETRLPPIEALREQAVDIAIASDCNPGTSPLCSLRSNMMLAARLFKLTPEECLAGVTRNAARALGLPSCGILQPGFVADIAVWDIDHPRDLAYWMGTPQLAELLLGGHTSPS